MELQRVNSSRVHKPKDVHQTLKPGDITMGKVVKLYPNQKAAIQIGNQTMVAQLEAPLTISTSYYFQVQHSSDDVIHLKVLHDPSKHMEPDNPRSLLNHLGLRATKSRLSLLALLVKDKIPFGKSQLRDAFQLIDKISDKADGQSIIKEMIMRKLPLTENTWKALTAYANSTLSDETRSMMHVLNDNPATGGTESLRNILGKLLLKPQSAETLLMNEIISESKQERSSFFNVLKTFGAMKKAREFSGKTSLEKSNHTNFMHTEDEKFHMFAKDMRHVSTILDNLHQANKKEGNIRQVANMILQKWNSSIHQALIHQKGLATHSITGLREVIQDKLIPFLPNETAGRMQALLAKNDASSMQGTLDSLQVMSKKQTYNQVQRFLTLVKSNEMLFSLNPKEQFIRQVNQLFVLGIGTGKSIPQVDVQEDTQTMKALLTQLLHNSDGVVHDKANQFIHFLNGLQLQSIHETTNFLEARLQIPAEKLGVHGDILIDVSGQKNESGDINPDYCHILFYLDLANIKETVINMQVQKRVIHLTIINAYESALQHVHKALQNSLKKGLEALDYDLQTVQFKPYHSKQEQGKGKAIPYSSIHQGVDYRI